MKLKFHYLFVKHILTNIFLVFIIMIEFVKQPKSIVITSLCLKKIYIEAIFFNGLDVALYSYVFSILLVALDIYKFNCFTNVCIVCLLMQQKVAWRTAPSVTYHYFCLQGFTS